MFQVLIVDDEASVRTYAELFLDWPSIDCEIAGTAANGQEALDFIRTHPVDIVLTDIQMPVMDGLSLSRQIDSLYPEIKVVLYTAYDEFSYAREAISTGVAGYVLKSDDPHTVTAFFQKLCSSIPSPAKEKNGQEAPSASPLIRMACDYIHKHYTENLTLNQIASHLNVHPVHLSRCFQQQLNKTYLEVLTAERMEAAMQMLKNDNLKVYEIGYALGYKKAAYFSSLFQKYTGLTPHDYRQLHQGEEP